MLLLACYAAFTAAAGVSSSGPPRDPPAAPHRIEAWQSARMRAAYPVAGASALAARLLGPTVAKQFVFEELSGEPTDVFAVGQRGGRPLVSGSSGVALTTGLYHYLKYFCNASVSVGALPQLALPQPLPLPRTRVRVPSPLQFHWYGSFMANSYTQAFWGWDRWENHLDWCALLGFDLVMVCESLRPRSPRITTSSAASQLSALLLSVRRSVDAGAEQVHAAVYAELGVTEAELGTFFSGAAFLGWSSTRAGNLRGMGGPITPQWRASKLALGRQIVARCRELGITPVLSGFNGHVPEALLKRIRPGSKYTRARPWNGFNCTDTDALGVATPPRPGCSSADCPRLGVVDVAPPFGCGFEVDPRDPLFLEIGARFIRKQRELYGNASDVHFYAAIQFTEEIPSAGSTLLPTADPAFLAAWGRATHGGMVAADPQAVWVLDGWFANANGEPWFWCGANRSRAQAYLSAVPLGGILILDLAADWTEHWRDPSFFGHPFIWCQFHENGGIMDMHGELQPIAAKMTKAMSDSLSPNMRMVGSGLCMEKFEDNPVVYEHFAEVMWSGAAPAAVDMPRWIECYAERRYGTANPEVREAWATLHRVFYHSTGEWGTSIRSWPPSIQTLTKFDYDVSAAPGAFRKLVAAHPAIPPSGRSALEYDMVMVGFAFLQTLFEDYWTLAVSACSHTARGHRMANATGCAPCNAGGLLHTQNFSEVPAGSVCTGAVELRLYDDLWPGLCLNASCTGAVDCWPLGMAPCHQLPDAERLFVRGGDGSLATLNGHVLDFGVYCPHCRPQVGLASNKIMVNGKLAQWQIWSNSSTAGRISTHTQSGEECCLEATNLEHPGGGSCADAIHATCRGLSGPACISCVVKHAASLADSCPDLNSQMHGVCGALWQHRTNSTHESAVCNATASLVHELIIDLDRLVGTHPMFLLGTWLADSKVGAANAADAANLEYGARNLLTLWGGDEGSDLAGYDGKIWAGLLRDHYGPIWKMLLNEMQTSKATGEPIDTTLGQRQFQFSKEWVRKTNHYATEPNGSVLDASLAVVSKYCPDSAQVARHFTIQPNTSVAGFTIPLARPLIDTDVGVLSALCEAHTECVGFTSKGELKTNVIQRVAKPGVDLFVSLSVAGGL